MDLRNKGKLMRKFDTGELVVVRKQVKSIIKFGIAQKFLFKTKGPYRFLEKVIPISYWFQCFTFCEGILRPEGKGKNQRP